MEEIRGGDMGIMDPNHNFFSGDSGLPQVVVSPSIHLYASGCIHTFEGQMEGAVV